MANESEELLRYGAVRARAHSSFVAHAFALYQQTQGLSDQALANFLGCSVPALDKLALCQRPSGAAADFRQRVEQIASLVGGNALNLGQLFRSVDAAAKLQATQAAAAWDSPPVRIAARRAGKVDDGDQDPQPPDGRRPRRGKR